MAADGAGHPASEGSLHLCVNGYRIPGQPPVGATDDNAAVLRPDASADPSSVLLPVARMAACGPVRLVWNEPDGVAELSLSLSGLPQLIAELRLPAVSGSAEDAEAGFELHGAGTEDAVRATVPAAGGLRSLLMLVHALHRGVIPAGSDLLVETAAHSRLPVQQPLPWYVAGGIMHGVLRSAATIRLARKDMPEPEAGTVALIRLSAPDRAALGRRVADLRRACPAGTTAGEAAARAATLSEPGSARAALLAGSPAELSLQLERLSATLADEGRTRLSSAHGLWFGSAPPSRGGIAVLFPGHGAQYQGMLAEQELHIPAVRSWFASLSRHVGADGILPCPLRHLSLADTPMADEARRHMEALEGGGVAAFAGCLGLFDALCGAGMSADILCGYSNGENAALVASGIAAFPDRAAMFRQFADIARAGRKGLARNEIPLGVSIAVTTFDREAVLAVATAANIHVVADNSPSQITLFGQAETMVTLVPVLRATGAQVLDLPNDRAYHTPAFAPEMPSVRHVLDNIPLGRARLPVLSCCSLEPFPIDPQKARTTAAAQYVGTIRFREALERLHADGIRIFVEAGPRGQLAAFARQTLAGRDVVIVEMDRPDRPGWRQTLSALGRLYIEGIDVTPESWFGPAMRNTPSSFR